MAKRFSMCVLTCYLAGCNKLFMATRCTVKFVLLGDACVGKTCIVSQLVDSDFLSNYRPTIGSDFACKTLAIGDMSVTLHLWDTAGAEMFQSFVGPIFYRGTECCVLVYDVTRAETFEKIMKYKKDFSANIGLSETDDFPFLLLGCKSDDGERSVQFSDAAEFAEKNNQMLFYEVSAKTGENIREAFEAALKRVMEIRAEKPRKEEEEREEKEEEEEEEKEDTKEE